MKNQIPHCKVKIAKTGLLGILIALIFFLVLGMPAAAFPPAPHYTLYGMVRDQVGQTVVAEGAEVILLKDGNGAFDHSNDIPALPRSGTTIRWRVLLEDHTG